jgi:hypothetical protein
MKILIPFALLLLSGCMSVDKLGPYELTPARNHPSITVQPVDLQAVDGAPGCSGSVVNGVCHESPSDDGRIAANAPGPTGN